MGPFDKYVISRLGGKINILTNDNPKIGKKLFKIFIELAQNVSFYSEEKRTEIDAKRDIGVGSLVIGETVDSYIFATGNAINNELVPVLAQKCEIINTLDRNSLRKYKREQRNLIPGSNDGAHIGLIMVALITMRDLDVEFIPIDEYNSYFTVTVRVLKKAS